LEKHVIIEKPLTGYYGANVTGFEGRSFSKEQMLSEATASCARILAAAKASGKRVCYAENWVYAPAIQKEREIIQKSGGQVLRMLGEQSHGGSHSPYYGRWKFSGGGSLVGKGCHPVSAALYLKRVEGESRNGVPIRPATVSARTHEITRLPNYRDEGFLRTGYEDIEDYAQIHITFSDGTVADIFSSELVMGGVITGWRFLQQSSYPMQSEPDQCPGDLQSAGRHFPGRVCGGEDQHQAGVELSCAG
jgi:hypothetical protein